MSLSTKTKVENVQNLTLITGGNITITNGVITPTSPSDYPTPEQYASKYRIIGSQTLVADVDIIMSGTPTENTRLEFEWLASAVPGVYKVEILGEAVPSYLLSKRFIMYCEYASGTWVNKIVPVIKQGQSIAGSELVDGSVTATQLGNGAVTYTKIQDVTAYSVPVRNAGTDGVLSSVAIAAQSLLGRVAAGFVAITASVNGTVLKMTGGNIGFAQLNFNELAGTIANTQIPSKEIALTKLASIGQIAAQTEDVGTTAVTTEETLFSYEIPADFISAESEGFEVDFCGTTAANANTKTIRVNFAGKTYLVNAVTTAPNNAFFSGSFKVFRGTTSSTAVGKGEMVVTATHQGIQGNKASVDWTIANTVSITGQNETASLDDIVLCHASVKVIR